MLLNTLPLITPLDEILIHRIQTQGPLSLAEYIEVCLYHPQYGFYMKASPIGQEGAFITAPEISQLFGEIVGLWCIQQWMDLGSPSQCALIELGPGKGTLMKDLLRATRHIKGFHESLTIHLVEISPSLKEYQASISFSRREWHSTLKDALKASMDLPTLIIANEFFDALPFHQYEMTPKGAREKCVGYEKGKFVYVLSKFSEPLLKQDIPIGKSYEVGSLARESVHTIANHLRRYKGACLAIDYGYTDTAFGDTFQALYKHSYCDPLDHRGEADLTAHVNFGELKEESTKLNMKNIHLTSQKDFLELMGIHLRSKALKKTASVMQAYSIDLAVKRLTQDMGALFKVLSFNY